MLRQKVRDGYPLRMALLQRELQLLRQPFTFSARSDKAGNVIQTHEHAGEFREP